jgi:hypothetical protein
VPLEIVYVNVPTPPAPERLITKAVPTVPVCTPDGPVKIISGLITWVGTDVSVASGAIPLVAVAVTTINFSSSEIVGM